MQFKYICFILSKKNTISIFFDLVSIIGRNVSETPLVEGFQIAKFETYYFAKQK